MEIDTQTNDKAVYLPALHDIQSASLALHDIVRRTTIYKSDAESKRYNANVFYKREDRQIVRSYKLRGAYNKMISLPEEVLARGVVCASAGNHAQGVAYSCHKLKVKGTIFMPTPTPKQKIRQVKMFGGEFVDVVLYGDTFDDASKEAMRFRQEHDVTFIHPFDDEKVIEGQGTVALEILADLSKYFGKSVDYLFVPIGGGGLISGVLSVFHALSPQTRIIGVEPKGAPSMLESLKADHVVTLEEIDKFVDGAAVKRVGDKPFAICREWLGVENVVTVDEGAVCMTILQLYDEEGIVLEPAGALSVAALEHFKGEIAGKNVVCILSGSNNDISRMEEIRERSLMYQQVKHYFIIWFPQRSGALREFVNEVLGENDDITYFSYTKKNSREKGPVVVGIELQKASDYAPMIQRMTEHGFSYKYLNEQDDLFQYLI
jgi:threonine dehydratase